MRGGGWRVLLGVGASIAATPGCGSGGPAAGSERGPCYGNGTCDDGLVCLSDHCVNLGDLPDAGTPDVASPVPDAPGPDVATRVDADVIVFVDADVSVLPDASPGGPCNPVTQLGCAPGQKCAMILDDPDTGTGHVGCAPDGTQDIGDPCTDATVAGATDDCAAGGDCYRGICHDICTTVSDDCVDGLCVTFVDALGDPVEIQICLFGCDLLLQDCAGEGEGCYIAGEPVCVGAGTGVAGDPCMFANGCVPGLICIGSAGDYRCRSMCGPWMDCFDGTGAVTACGCGDTVACAADEICFAIGDGLGGTIDDIAGVCLPEADSGGCDCTADPICPP